MYKEFFSTKLTAEKWEKIGYSKRAGVCIPLFSIYTDKSLGIGEIPDLKHIIDWCCKSGFSIILLLPLNDTGGNISPYSSISSFAIDPVYVSLNDLIKKFKLKNLEHSLKEIITNSDKSGLVDYSVRKTKLEFLKIIYEEVKHINTDNFREFKEINDYWLKDYCLYVILKDIYQGCWESWDSKVRDKDDEICNEILLKYSSEVELLSWIQYQLFLQLSEIKKYASERNIFIMGDIPFLVSRDSADTWAHKNYFKFDLAAGAPPDMYFSSGQKWGMPAYNWDNISNDGFVYLKERLKYAENFYNMYRIDHFIGLFRLWVSNAYEDITHGAMNGRFEPENEKTWYEHGTVIIEKMLEFTDMMPCAEDLGTVPLCSYEALNRYGITGMDFQRFYKNNNDFIKPENYRINSCSVISTHDSSHFSLWWDNEAGTIDENLFDRIFLKYRSADELTETKTRLFDREKSLNGRLYWKNDWIDSIDKLLWELRISRDNAREFIDLYQSSYREKEKFIDFLSIDYSADFKSEPVLFEAAFEKALESRSIFSIQLITDILLLDKKLHDIINKNEFRINKPGMVNEVNWRVRLPIRVDKLKRKKFTEKIKEMIIRNKRI